MLIAAVALAVAQTPVPTTSKLGMVVADEKLAAEVGAQILRKGGNAVDAAVATGFAMAVVQPSAGNIGGGGFMLVRLNDSRTLFIDYREMAPLAASRDMYLDAQGNPTRDSLIGYRASGVPGTVAGMAEAHRRFGRLKWSEVVEPAYQLAHRGFPVSGSTARGLQRTAATFKQFPESYRVLNRSGNFYKPGETVKMPELAATLKRIRDKGASDFYSGETAKLIAADMKQNGGLVTMKDLAGYKVRLRTPLKGTYRGHTVVTAPPPSSGGIALLQMLNMLEVRAPLGGADRAHYMVEAMRRAFADRSELLADPDFVKVPVAQLVTKAYARTRAQTISLDTVSPSAEVRPGMELPKESEETTHYSVVDRWGNAVANTYTINGSYGSGVMIKGAGFLMNNEMDDFTSKPGSPNLFGLIQGPQNAIQPGKRPLSSMTPTILLDPQGKLIAVLGSPGGSTIINTVFHLVTNVVDRKMPIFDAVKAPRFHHQWMPDRIDAEPTAFTNAERAALEKLGHKISGRGSIGSAQCIGIDPKTGIITGAPDPRYSDSAGVGQ